MNSVLYDEDSIDQSLHEQHLIVFEKSIALVMGCGHFGIVNIMNKASEFNPKVCEGLSPL